ncbi:MAG: hypothetical protein DWQ02_16045 [Bacteroidetes bacterium]|nr:MAG: hypothetical protein DWQ02_16045 [Bacteroidota bacterium]
MFIVLILAVLIKLFKNTQVLLSPDIFYGAKTYIVPTALVSAYSFQVTDIGSLRDYLVPSGRPVGQKSVFIRLTRNIRVPLPPISKNLP